MTGRGRPRIGAPIMVRLPADMVDALDAEADALGVPRAELIRTMLEAAIIRRSRRRHAL